MTSKTGFIFQLNLEELHPRYLELVEEAFKIVGDKFFKAPASTRHHHAYPGGLKDHTREVYNICSVIADEYPDKVNQDILLTSALTHDIAKHMNYTDNILQSGKLSEAKPYKRTQESKVLDHIGDGLIIMTTAGNTVNFPLPKLKPILHCIASHHGDTRFGWGSLVNPNSAEAHILHHADMISSRLARFDERQVAVKRSD